MTNRMRGDDKFTFFTLTELQQQITDHVKAVRVDLANLLRMRALEYEIQLLNEPDAVKKAWLEGISEGYRAAAVEIEPERVPSST